MRYLSLFSGIEACTVAWHELGWEAVAYCEFDKFPSATLDERYPDVLKLGDVTEITDDDIKALGHIDVVVGGSPCQDLSLAGKRAGLAGERSGLFHEQMRIFHAARHFCGARFLLWENVPGAFSANAGADFGVVVGEMAGCRIDVPPDGWGTAGVALGENGLVEWRVLDAQYVRVESHPGAVPQRRRRVFAVLDTGNWSSRSPILLEPESMQGHPPPRREAGERVAPSVTTGPPFSRTGNERIEADAMIPEVSKAIKGNSGGIDREDMHTLVPDVSPCICESGGNARPGDNVQSADTLIPEVANALTARMHKGLNSDVNEGQTPIIETIPIHDKATRHSGKRGDLQDGAGNGLGIGKPDDPCFTLTSGDQHAVCIQGSMIGRSDQHGPQGDGFNHEVSFTLNTVDRHAVAFAQNQRDEVRTMEVAGALSAEPGMKQQTFIAFTSVDNGADAAEGLSPTLRVGAGGNSGSPPAVQYGMKVRRLTPRECERLQGFPDDYTQIPYRGRPADKCPDGPRYKALGNSMAVNVMNWIGRRIDAVCQ